MYTGAVDGRHAVSHPDLIPVSHVSSEEAELQRQIAQLRAALQPFADAYTPERWGFLIVEADGTHDDTDVAELRYDDTGVTLGMLRAARDALAEPGDLTRAEADELRRQGDG